MNGHRLSPWDHLLLSDRIMLSRHQRRSPASRLSTRKEQRRLFLESLEERRVLAAEVTIAVAPAAVNEDGATNLVYTLTRSDTSAGALPVNVTFGGTAAESFDYAQTGASGGGASKTVTFAAASTTATITVNPVADLGFEPNETVIVTVEPGDDYDVGGDDEATGTITNDDTPQATLDGDGNLLFEDVTPGGRSDSATVSISGGNLILVDPANVIGSSVAGSSVSDDQHTVTIPLASITGSKLIFDTGAGDDELTIHLGTLAKDIEFHGGDDTDTLSFTNGALSSLVYDATDDQAGTLTLGGARTVTFTGLEPVVFDATVTANTVTINVDPLNNFAGAAIGTEFTAVAAGITRATFTGPALESIDFPNPTQTLIVNGGTDDDDTITFTSLGGGFAAAVTVNGGGGSDSIVIDAPLSLGAASVGDVSLTAESIAVNQPISTAAAANRSISLSGNTITLGANLSTDGGNVSIAAATAAVIAANVTIDTEAGDNSAAGAVSFGGTALIRANAAGRNLTINTGTSGGANGAVTLAAFGSSGGQLVNNLSIDADDPATAGGTVTIPAVSQIAGTLSITGGPIASNAQFTAGAATTIALTSDAGISDGNGSTTNFIATAGSLTATAAGTIDLDVRLATLGTVTTTVGNIDIAGTNSLVVAGDVTAPGTITLTASDSAAAGDNLTISANVISTSGGTIQLQAGDDIIHTAGTIGTAGLARFTADHEGAVVADGDRGSITQSGGNLLAVSAVFRAFGEVNYISATNNVDNLAAVLTGATAGADFEYRDADGVFITTVDTVNGITTAGGDATVCAGDTITLLQGITAGAGTVRLQTVGTGHIVGTAPIVAAALGATAEQNVDLLGPNDVGILQGSAGGFFAFRNVSSLSVGTVLSQGCYTGGGSGVSGTNVEIVLDAGDLAIAGPITADNAIRLEASGGSVSQTVAGVLTGDRLGVRAAANIDLDTALNQIDVVFSAESDVAGVVEFRDAGGVTIDDVSAGFLFVATTGIQSVTGAVTLSNTGAVTQNDPILAPALQLLGDGPYTLTLATNDVDTLAADTTGAINFRDDDDLIVGTVSGLTITTVGITTTSDDVQLRTDTALSIEDDIDLAGGDLGLNIGAAATQTAGDTIIAAGLALTGAGPYTLTNAGNDVNTLAANTSESIQFRDSDDLIIGAVDVLTVVTTGVTTSSDDVTLQTGGGLSITQAFNVVGGDIRLNVAGTVTQSGAGVVSGDELGVDATDDVLLCTLTNDVNSLAVSTSADIVEFRDADDLTIGSVAALAPLFDGASGIVTGGADANLRTGGSLAINSPFDVGAADIRLVVETTAGVSINQTAPTTADELGIVSTGGGTVTLNVGNDVNQLAAISSGSFQYRDLDDLEIETVTSGGNCDFIVDVDGVSVTGDILITVDDTAASGEDLEVREDVTATGNVTLQFGDDFLLETGNSINAGIDILLEGDTGGAVDAAGTVILIQGTTGLVNPGNDAGEVATIRGNVDSDLIRLNPQRLADGNVFVVEGNAGSDRFRLEYAADYDGPAALPVTSLTIDAGVGDADVIDIDQSLDMLPRKRQFAYVTTGDGLNTNFISDIGPLGVFDNENLLGIRIREMDQYVIRAGNGTDDLDQLIIVGLPTAANEITVGNIVNGGNADPLDDLPITPRRFGTSGSELVRAVGGAAVDTIDLDDVRTAPQLGAITSDAQFVIIEALGGESTLATDPGEFLRGARDVPNLIFGAGTANPLVGILARPARSARSSNGREFSAAWGPTARL